MRIATVIRASLAGLVLSFIVCSIACFILLVIAPLGMHEMFGRTGPQTLGGHNSGPKNRISFYKSRAVAGKPRKAV